MTTILVTCRRCGQEFVPDKRAILRSAWRLCPVCQPQSSEESHCEHCGRVLLAGPRTICARCLGVPL
jgi:hypothetical protein